MNSRKKVVSLHCKTKTDNIMDKQKMNLLLAKDNCNTIITECMLYILGIKVEDRCNIPVLIANDGYELGWNDFEDLYLDKPVKTDWGMVDCVYIYGDGTIELGIKDDDGFTEPKNWCDFTARELGKIAGILKAKKDEMMPKKYDK